MENRERLIAAVGRLLAAQGSVTLSEVAAEAGVSRATAYRNFDSSDDAILAYIAAFLDEFEESTDSVDSLRDLCSVWGRLVADRGYALVHVRSTEGFLARLRRSDPVISRIDRVVRRVLAADAEFAVAEAAHDRAVFVWNALLDPRELLDLAEHANTTVEIAADAMTDVLYAALEHKRPALTDT
ncbi:MAG: TetR family transcriptional regulator [Acidimicrobiaceae bacterium]|nr:MAG: TetR family transcriptional regulator [Acidimicrobiaceae bacterium]